MLRVLCVLCGCTFSACATTPRPIFPPPDPSLTWPAPPQPARIRYVGMIETAADLEPPRRLFQGVVDLLAGKKEPHPLYGPRDLIVTPDNRRVWIADPGGRCIHGLDLEDRTYRKVTRVGSAPLLTPVSVCLGSAGSIYVCDSEAVAIYRISAIDGTSLEMLPLPDEIGRPVSVTLDGATNELFVADVVKHNIKVLDGEGRLLRILGRRGNDPGEFNYPAAVVFDGDRLWVADSGNYRVQAVTRTGEPIASFGQAGDAPGDLALPKDVALDSDAHVYVVDARFENVQVFDRAGRLLLYFGEEGTGPAQFWLPSGMYIDRQDRIWICDSYNRRIQVFQYVGEKQPQRAQSP